MIDAVLTGLTMATPSGNLTTSTVTLLKHPSGPVLFDTAAWNQRSALVRQLAARGLQPEDVETIILTHLHWDHCMNFDLFPGARVLVPEGEWRRVRDGDLDPATPAYILDLLQERSRAEPFSAGEVLEGISAVDTPGHTVGHTSFLLEDNHLTVAITGDAVATRSEAEAGLPRTVFGDQEAAEESVRQLLARASVLVPGHDTPFHSAPGLPAVVTTSGTNVGR